MRKIIRDFENPQDKAQFTHENLLSNIKNATKLLYIIIVFEILMLAITFLTQSRPYPAITWRYITCYISLLILSVLILAGILAATRSKRQHLLFTDIITTVYGFVILLWSIAITVLDSVVSERFIVYLTVILCLTSMLKLRPWIFLSVQIGGYALLNTELVIFFKRFDSAQLINLTVFTTIFVVITITKYNSSVEEFYTRKKIIRLNAMLESEKSRFEMAAKTDQLTGLYSRNILKADTERRIANNYQKGMATGVAMFDLDDFKLINDTYGHAVGDECLRLLGDCFRQHAKLTVYRYGGEEFLAIADEISEPEFVRILTDIRQRVAAFQLSVESLRITISAGYVYQIPESETSDEKMINAADRALYEAKAAGKNCCIKG